ncbi:DUF2070 family protein [Candidatus Nanohalobium constans]|uniref:Putative membrane protein n=1 Tax=Candidatus Nanohalobium constans TaxID=2565781 RepID=A0A5Q0UEY3_9ARCH|nr:DUF2070 family protein [Candidatus Nanohalobium constans]QGA80153.1 putative membrane protein [Candidatus Nanohalobium constans]
MTDNLDIFKKVIFKIPSVRKLSAAIIILSTVYSSLIFVSLNLFTPFGLPLYTIPLIALSAFILPGVLSGELLYRFIPNYPRNWGYFLMLSNISLLAIYGLILAGADTFTNAWHIFWLSLTTVYLSNLLVLLLTLGQKYILRITVLALIQPLTILTAFHHFIGARTTLTALNYISGLYIMAIGGFLFLLSIAVAEYLMRSNLKDASVLQLTAGLLQKRQEALDLGYSTKPDVQTLKLSNQASEASIAVPWIHPGPLEGFGGGRITSDIIKQLNQDEEGFFFHVPSTHKSDPSDPEDYRKILDAMNKPEESSKASKLVRKDYEQVSFYGRKVGGKKLVFMDAGWDDYEVSVFREIIDPEKVLIVDLHCQDRKEEEREEVWYNTEESEHLRECLKDFISELESLEEYDYSNGFTVELEGKPVFALVEQVKDQKTVLFGLEGNGNSEEVRNLRKKLGDDYDHAIAFSTDTHQSIHQLSSDKQIETSRINDAVNQAENKLSKASIGFANQKAEDMKLLQEDYSGLIFSINMLIRLIGLLLTLMYIWLVIWVFF